MLEIKKKSHCAVTGVANEICKYHTNYRSPIIYVECSVRVKWFDNNSD